MHIEKIVIVLLLLIMSAVSRAEQQDVTNDFTISASGFVFDRSTGLFISRVTLTNKSFSSFFPLWFAVSGLPVGVSIANSNTEYVSGTYQTLITTINEKSVPGTSSSIVIQLSNPKRISVSPLFTLIGKKLDDRASISTPDGTLTIATQQSVVKSDNRRYIGVNTITRSILEPDAEGTASSTFEYFNSSGLVWSATAPDGSSYYIPDPAYSPDQIITPDGSRILLVSSGPGNIDPVVSVYDQFGNLIYQPSFEGLVDLQRAQISLNGRYVLLQGTLHNENLETGIIKVISIANKFVTDYLFDPSIDGTPHITSLNDGGFLVKFADKKEVVLP